ncbi:hypothetical protein ACIA8K_16415 [Catenuloplanes sp. NPDC051500]|uniref:hypothetical protein n=1 Tax=Catenuloplanes sp. NPDC051500 TaxID=3363959 RepID=UPI0037ADA3BA
MSDRSSRRRLRRYAVSVLLALTPLELVAGVVSMDYRPAVYLVFLLLPMLTAAGTALVVIRRLDPLAAPGVPKPQAAVSEPLPPVRSAASAALPAPRPFAGRQAELHLLTESYRRQQGQDTGAVQLYLHGPAGSGKSAVALHFAHRVADEHPDGRVCFDFRISADRRSTNDVLEAFTAELAHLAAPGQPAGPRRFGTLLNGRRVLIVLLGAEDAGQIQELIPFQPGCTVIVTSRRSLGPSVRVGEATRADAVRILRLAMVSDRPLADSVYAARIVRQAGRLPRALRAAGERAAGAPAGRGQPGKGLAEVSRELDSVRRPLEVFQFREHDIGGQYRDEYDGRLLPREQEALRMLALVGSDSFLPWVLSPLLEIGFTEAEDVMASLYAAQFVADSGPDRTARLARYRLNALVRRFAAEKLDSVPAASREAARRRLLTEYLAIVEAVLRRIEPGFARGRPASPSYLPDLDLPVRISRQPRRWIRAEYLNLVAAALYAAENGEPELVWRIMEHLGDCVPRALDRQRCRAAFDAATAAAETDPTGGDYARISVMLARCGYLIGIEHYDEALELLRYVSSEAGPVADKETDQVRAGRLRLFRAQSERRIGEIRLRIGNFTLAHVSLETARDHAPADPGEEATAERTLIALLLAEAEGHLFPREWLQHDRYDGIGRDNGDEAVDFALRLCLAESEIRNARWHQGIDHLDTARERADDWGRTAIVDLRVSRLHLCRLRDTKDPVERTRLAEDAADRAAAAVVSFERTGSMVGVVRSRLQLAEVLLLAGALEGAEEQLHLAEQDREEAREARIAAGTMEAGIRRVRGLLRLARRQDFGDGRIQLNRAESIVEEYGDWCALADVRLQLGRTHAAMARQYHRDELFFEATTYLAKALNAYSEALDRHGIARVLTAINDVDAEVTP